MHFCINAISEIILCRGRRGRQIQFILYGNQASLIPFCEGCRHKELNYLIIVTILLGSLLCWYEQCYE